LTHKIEFGSKAFIRQTRLVGVRRASSQVRAAAVKQLKFGLKN
jgi:hypothetical protein